MENKRKIPTEIVTLPSKGLLYPENNPLAKGEIEMSYMTAREEDILTNANYLRNGTVIDKLLQSLIVTPINFDDLIIGDKDAIMIAARILGYGREYSFTYENREHKVDLADVKEKVIDESIYKRGLNEFMFTLPKTQNIITFKILTHGDEKKINAELKGLEKINPNGSYGVTTRLKYMITSVNNNRDKNEITSFISNELIAMDARALRKEYERVSPGIDLKFFPDENYAGEGVDIPIGVTFFWPDA